MSFSDWLEEHPEIEQLLKYEPIEALSLAFHAGYVAGGQWLAGVVKEAYHGKD